MIRSLHLSFALNMVPRMLEMAFQSFPILKCSGRAWPQTPLWPLVLTFGYSSLTSCLHVLQILLKPLALRLHLWKLWKIILNWKIFSWSYMYIPNPFFMSWIKVYGSPFFFSWKDIDKNDRSLDEGQQRVVSSFLRSARNGGIALEGKDKERFNAIQLRLAELGNKFRWLV